MHLFVKEVAFVKEAAYFWLKGRILEFFSHCMGKVAYSDQSLHFLWSWSQMVEGSQETGTPALVSRDANEIPSRDADKGGV
jgi:hypothetical protein